MDIYYLTKTGELKEAKVIKEDGRYILEKDNGRVVVGKNDPIFTYRCWYSNSLPEAVAISQNKNTLMDMILSRIFYGEVKRLNADVLEELKMFIRKRVVGE